MTDSQEPSFRERIVAAIAAEPGLTSLTGTAFAARLGISVAVAYVLLDEHRRGGIRADRKLAKSRIIRAAIARHPAETGRQIAARILQETGVVVCVEAIQRNRCQSHGKARDIPGRTRPIRDDVRPFLADPANVALVIATATRHADDARVDRDDVASIATWRMPKAIGDWIDDGRPGAVASYLVTAARDAVRESRRYRIGGSSRLAGRREPFDPDGLVATSLSPLDQVIFDEELAIMEAA